MVATVNTSATSNERLPQGTMDAGRPWSVAPRAPEALFAALADLHPVAVQVLYNRGLDTAAKARTFLAGDGAELHDPRQLRGMEQAVERLRRAIRDGETIAVHGDFDVDGVTSTAILTEGLRAAGATVVPYVPQRTTTGYGVHASAVDKLAADGATLIVTGDTGTRALGAVERAAELGLDVIVTDHHVPGESLPAAVALINPQQAQCAYPFKLLAGAGVAWKLIHALELNGMLGGFQADDLLDLVALGTIVDVAPLLGENRALVRRGLRRLAAAPRPGVRALLLQSSSRSPRATLPIDERTVAFSLGPRLNAAGRMDDPGLALEVLMTADAARAATLVQSLEEINRQRRQLTETVLQAARQQADTRADQAVLVLRGEGWPTGVIGLVAARIADEYRRPAIVVDVGPEACRGSGRSVDGFDLVAALTGCADLLIEFGGHTQAAGFAVRPPQLDALVERLLDAAVQQRLAGPRPVLADCALAAGEVDWGLYRALAPLRPFGAGNPQPLFATSGVRVLEARPVGTDGRHLRARLRLGSQVLTAFGPDLGSRARTLAAAGAADALFNVETSTWDGLESLELKLQDARPAAS